MQKISFIIYTNINLRKIAGNICCGAEPTTIIMLQSFSIFFKGKSSSELKLIYILFSS